MDSSHRVENLLNEINEQLKTLNAINFNHYAWFLTFKKLHVSKDEHIKAIRSIKKVFEEIKDE